MIDRLSVVALSEFFQGLGEVVGYEAVVVGEEVRAHLGYLPTGNVVVYAVEESGVFPDYLGQRHKQMGKSHHHVYWVIGISEHHDGRMAGHSVFAAREHARFAIGLECCDHLFGHALQVGHLVESDGIPQAH